MRTAMGAAVIPLIIVYVVLFLSSAFVIVRGVYSHKIQAQEKPMDEELILRSPPTSGQLGIGICAEPDREHRDDLYSALRSRMLTDANDGFPCANRREPDDP